jgi:hypothetical protein
MRFLRILGRSALALVALIGALFLAARFMDGPLGAVPGGALQSGPLVVEGVEDWSFAADVDTIEMQLISDGRSRTVWILVREGQGFIPCAIGAPPGKTWHLHAEEDGRALIRVNGKRYPVTLTRVADIGLQDALGSVTQDKYPSPPGADGESWYFKLASRQED